MKKVVILQHRLLHYRVTFFEKLRQACFDKGIELHLVHGQASRREKAKKDEGALSWAHKMNNRFWEIGPVDVIWQTFPAPLRDADLFILIQENRIVSQYLFLLKRLFSRCKVAYWGHGVNLQSRAPSGIRERWKSFLLTKVDWWFAYTSSTVELLGRSGFPLKRVTCLDNAIDTSGFKTDLASVSERDLIEVRKNLGIAQDAPVGLFCGSLYPDKRLDILIEASDRIQALFPQFHLVVLGDGPSAPVIRDAALTRPWLHVLGIKKGADKALFFRLADLMLNPGAVGLHIVDAFCAGLILVTTDKAKHGPEIAYLRDKENALMTVDDSAAYAAAVVSILNDRDQMACVRSNALADSEKYTLDNMVSNFVNGLELALVAPKG